MSVAEHTRYVSVAEHTRYVSVAEQNDFNYLNNKPLSVDKQGKGSTARTAIENPRASALRLLEVCNGNMDFVTQRFKPDRPGCL